MNAKRIGLILVALAIGVVTYAQTVVKYDQFHIIATNTIPRQIVTTNLYVRGVTFVGIKGVEPITNNAGLVYVGASSTDGQQFITVTPAGEVVVSVKDNQLFNLKDWYLDAATTNDGVGVIYY